MGDEITRELTPEGLAAAARAVVRGRAARRGLFELFPPPPGNVVFLGDSIIEAGLWAEWLPSLPVINRGVGGDTVQQVAERLDSAIIDPAAVVVLVGTNDLGSVTRLPRDPAAIARDFRALIGDLRRRAGTAGLIVHTIPPRTAELAATICALNEEYRSAAAEADARLVDLYALLAGEDGAIRPAFSYDDLHFTAAAYSRWLEALVPHMPPPR